MVFDILFRLLNHESNLRDDNKQRFFFSVFDEILYNLKKLVISILIEHISNDLIIVKKASIYNSYFNNIAITIKTQNEHINIYI